MEQLFKPSVIWDSILAIIPSIPITMLITLIAGLLGLLFGFILAVLRIKKIPVLAQLATVYPGDSAAGAALFILLRDTDAAASH